MSENKDLREEQNKRRDENEPLTLETMLRDLREEAEDPRTDTAQKEMLKDLLDLEERTRRP